MTAFRVLPPVHSPVTPDAIVSGIGACLGGAARLRCDFLEGHLLIEVQVNHFRVMCREALNKCQDPADFLAAKGLLQELRTESP